METTWLTIVLLLARACHSARILVLQPINVRSHSIVMDPLFEELAARGHHLTVFTCFPHKPPLPNLQEVDLSYKLPPAISNFSFTLIRETFPNLLKAPFFMSDFELSMCKDILPEPPLQRLIESEEKFDLVMIELFSSDCYVPFAHKFNAPLISFMTSSALPWAADRVGLPDNPSYIPNYLVDFSPNMTLYQRIYNSITLIAAKLIHNYYCMPQTTSIINTYFGESYPPLDSMLKKTSLIFVNSHFSLSLSRPFPPNVVEIGGIHINNDSKPLPLDLQNILNQSPQGVILMSFGSLVRTSTIPQDIIQMFMKAFSTIPQTVIFKYEDHLANQPQNVIIRKWLPQRQIIEHKNVKVLLAHGGLASTIESIYFAKPLIGVPFFADQYLNVKAIVRRGAGLMLDLDNLSEKKIIATIQEVLDNPIYSENVRRLSLQFRDRPMSPLQSAVYWTEYVIRHQGAPHLQPASVNLPLYQYLLLDVIPVLLLPVLLIMYIVYFLCFRAMKTSHNDKNNYKLKKEN